MANSKGSSNIRNLVYAGKHSLLPPKSPFPSISPAYSDYAPTLPVGAKGVPRPRDGNSHHQRTSSESHIIDEQPSWLDELLNEPETPVRRGGHRRSSSDSFAYIDAVNNISNMDYASQDDYKIRNMISVPSWGSQDFDHFKDASRNVSFYADPSSFSKPKNRAWDYPNGVPSARDSVLHQSTGSSSALHEADGAAGERQEHVESGPHDSKTSTERKDAYAKNSTSDTDTKRAKQQFAQRSRVRKLQYIAELERNVQALQAEGSEVSAQLEFLNQQNLILSMENKNLKQRLESLTQEQLIKYLEHEVLEREIGRLRSLHQQQQLQQQQPPQSLGHRRSNSRDLDSQFSNLSLKHKQQPTSSNDLHI